MVRFVLHSRLHYILSQAAVALETLQMASPVKKLDFAAQGPIKAKPLVGLPPLNKPAPKDSEADALAKANYEDEPLLRENPNRFVLFPLKYHEVRVLARATRVKWFLLASATNTAADLADVQEGRGFLLDCRRD